MSSRKADIPVGTETRLELSHGRGLARHRKNGGSAAEQRHAADALRFAPRAADADRWTERPTGSQEGGFKMMLDWNDYQRQLLATISEIGKISPDTVRG